MPATYKDNYQDGYALIAIDMSIMTSSGTCSLTPIIIISPSKNERGAIRLLLIILGLDIGHQGYTVNSEIFAKFNFRETSHNAKFHENQNLMVYR